VTAIDRDRKCSIVELKLHSNANAELKNEYESVSKTLRRQRKKRWKEELT